MSGFVASVSLDGRPSDPGTMTRLCDAAPFRGAARIWTDGAASLAALGSAQHSSPGGSRVALVFDGRLDNRRELAGRLALPDGRSATDALLARQAYDRWHVDCAASMVGDFAFAAWDPVRRELFCARDPLGIRPLYYTVAAGSVVVASDLLQVLAAHQVTPRPNEGMLAEYLAGSIRSRDETVYEGIHRLPGGHWMRVRSDGQVVSGCYWRPGEGSELRYATDAQYCEEFRELFFEAIRCRLPPEGPVAIYLSGGVDSSALTAGTCAVTSPARTIAFSLAFGEDPELHERRYMREVAEWCGVDNVVTRAEDPAGRPAPPFSRDPHDWQRDLAAHEWKRTVRARGVTVALTGRGGDDTFLGSQYHYADLLRRGRLRAAWRQWRADPAVLETDPSLLEFFQFGVWPLLPPGFRAMASPLARRSLGHQPLTAPWLDARFSQRVDLPGRLREPYGRLSGSSARDAIIRGSFELSGRELRLETAEREGAEHGLEELYPFLDRRVVDFGLRLPDDQRWRGDITRFVVRKALEDRLPPSIRTRTSTGEGSHRLVSSIDAMGGSTLVDRLSLAECGWVRQDVVSAMYRRVQRQFGAGADDYVADAQVLWGILGTELWFRAAYGGAILLSPETE